MANGIQELRGLYGTFQKWLDDAKVPEKEVDRNGDGKKIVAFVLGHRDIFSPKIQKEIEVLRQAFRSLGFDEKETETILTGKDGAKKVIEKGEAFEKSAAEKIAAGQKGEGERLLQNAEKAYRMAVDLDPASANAYRHLAHLNFTMGRATEARENAKLAVQNAGEKELGDLVRWLKSIEDPAIQKQEGVNFAAAALVEVHRYAEAKKIYQEASQEAANNKDKVKSEQYRDKGLIVEELEKPYSRGLTLQDPPIAKLDLALRAQGIPSALIDGKYGPEFHVPDGTIRDRDVILYVGRNLDGNPAVQAALAEAGIDEDKFRKLYYQTLRDGLKENVEKFQSLRKSNPIGAREMIPILDGWAFELNWQEPANKSDRVENLKVLRSYYPAVIDFFSPPFEDANKQGEYKDTLISLENEWASLVKGHYPGVEGLDAQGYLKPEQVEDATIRVIASGREFLGTLDKDINATNSYDTNITENVANKAKALEFLNSNTEFILLPSADQEKVIQTLSLSGFPHLIPNVTAERRVAHSYYLLGLQAEGRGNWEKAAGFYEQALQHAPEVGDIRIAAAKNYLESAGQQANNDYASSQQLYQKAMVHLDAATSKDNQSIEAWRMKGEVEMARGNPEEARNYFTIALGFSEAQDLGKSLTEDSKLTQGLQENIRATHRLEKAQAGVHIPQGDDRVRSEKSFEAATDDLKQWANTGIFGNTAELDVSKMSFSEKSDPAKKIQDALIKDKVAADQVRPGWRTSDPLPSAREYQEYAFAHYDQFSKEIEATFGKLPFDAKGKLDPSIESKLNEEWKEGTKGLQQKLKSAGLQPGTPEYGKAFQEQLQRPENASLRASQVLLDPAVPTRLKALAFFQFQGAKRLEFAGELMKNSQVNPKDAQIARELYLTSAVSFQNAFALSQKTKDAKNAAMAYFAAGNLSRKQGDEAEARRLFLKGTTVLQGLRDLPYPDNLFQNGEALELMGNALREAGKYPEAMQMYIHAWAAGNHSASVKESVVYVNKFELSLSHVDKKFLDRMQKLEAKEDKGKLSSAETKELARMRRGISALKKINQEFFPGSERAVSDAKWMAQGHYINSKSMFPSTETPRGVVDGDWIPDPYKVMEREELPLIKNLRWEILQTLQVPMEDKKLAEVEGHVERLENAVEGLREVDQARRAVLDKYPAYVQEDILANGSWQAMKIEYNPKADNIGQNVDDIPNSWNPDALNKNDFMIHLSAVQLGDPKLKNLFEIFQRPSLISSDISDLATLETEVNKIKGQVFKTESRLDPKTGKSVTDIPTDPITGGKDYKFSTLMTQVLGSEKAPDPTEQPNLWVRAELGKGMQELGNTKDLLGNLADIKKDYEETTKKLAQAKQSGDSIQAQELEKKLGDLNQKISTLVANSNSYLETQPTVFRDRSDQFISMMDKLQWRDDHGNSHFGNDQMDGAFFSYTPAPLDPASKNPAQTLDALINTYQDLAQVQARYVHHLAISNAAIANKWNPSFDVALGNMDAKVRKYDELFGNIEGPRDLEGFLRATQTFLQKTDEKMFQDLPANLHEGIGAQLQTWHKIRDDMSGDYRVGQVDSLIANYEAAQKALDEGDTRKALSLFQLATDSKNTLLAQDAYSSYKKWQSIGTLVLELAVITVATILTAGATAELYGVVAVGFGAGLVIEGTVFTGTVLGLHAGLYYGGGIGHNPFKDEHGNWLSVTDYLWEDVKNIAMFGALKGVGKAFRGAVLADAEMKGLVDEAFTLSEGKVGGRVFSEGQYKAIAMEQRYQAKLAQLGWLRKAGFKTGEIATEALTFHAWNNVAALLDVAYQNNVHDKKLDWKQQLEQVNSAESIIHGLVFLGGLKLGGLLTHPLMGSMGSARAKEAQKVVQGDIQYQTRMAFEKKAYDFQSRLVSYDADPNFKFLNAKDQEDAKKLIKLGDQTYLPENKKGVNALDSVFLTEDQKAWLETRDVLMSSIRYSQEKGPPAETGSQKKDQKAPEPMPKPDTPRFAKMVEGVLPYASDSSVASREAVKNWVHEKVPDQAQYQTLLSELAARKKVLTVHDGKVYLEDVAKVQIRIQQASRLYQNLAEKFGVDPKKYPNPSKAFLDRAASDPTLSHDKIEKEWAAIAKGLKPILKSVGKENQVSLREGFFRQAMEGNLSVERVQDLAAQVENGSFALVPASSEESAYGYKVVPAFYGMTVPLGIALLLEADSATPITVDRGASMQKIKVGGKAFEIEVKPASGGGEPSISIRRADNTKGEVLILKKGSTQAQPLAKTGSGDTGTAFNYGDTLIVDGKSVTFRSPLEVRKETAYREQIIKLGADIESDRAELAKLPPNSPAYKTAQAALDQKSADYRALLGDSGKKAETLIAKLGVSPASPEGKGLILALVDSGKVEEIGKGLANEEIKDLGSFLRDRLKIDPKSEAGKNLLHQLASALAHRDRAGPLMKEFPGLADYVVAMEQSGKQLVAKAGLGRSKDADALGRDLAAIALEKAWTKEQFGELGKVLTNRPDLLPDIVNAIAEKSKTPLSESVLGKRLMGQFLLDAARASTDPRSFAATLLNFESQARFRSETVDQIMVMQGEISLDLKVEIFRQAMSEEQGHLDWKNELQRVANGEIEWRLENGKAVRIEHTEEEGAPRQKKMAKEMASLPTEVLSWISTEHFSADNQRIAMEGMADRVLRSAGYQSSSPDYVTHRKALLEHFQSIGKGKKGLDSGNWPSVALEIETRLKNGEAIDLMRADGSKYSLERYQIEMPAVEARSGAGQHEEKTVPKKTAPSREEQTVPDATKKVRGKKIAEDQTTKGEVRAAGYAKDSDIPTEPGTPKTEKDTVKVKPDQTPTTEKGTVKAKPVQTPTTEKGTTKAKPGATPTGVNLGDLAGPTHLALLVSRDGIDTFTADLETNKTVRLDSQNKKIPGKPWKVDITKGADGSLKIVPVEGVAEIWSGGKYIEIPKEGVVLKEASRVRLGDLEFDWKGPSEAHEYAFHQGSTQRDEFLIGSFVDYFSHSETRGTLEVMSQRSDSWGEGAKKFKEGLSQFDQMMKDYRALEKDYDKSPDLAKRPALAEKHRQVMEAWDKLTDSPYYRMERDHSEAISEWKLAVSPLERALGFMETQQLFEVREGQRDRMGFTYEAVPTPPENLGDSIGNWNRVPSDKLGHIEVTVDSWNETTRIAKELGHNSDLKVDGKVELAADGSRTLKVQIDGAKYEVRFKLRSEAKAPGKDAGPTVPAPEYKIDLNGMGPHDFVLDFGNSAQALTFGKTFNQTVKLEGGGELALKWDSTHSKHTVSYHGSQEVKVLKPSGEVKTVPSAEAGKARPQVELASGDTLLIDGKPVKFVSRTSLVEDLRIREDIRTERDTIRLLRSDLQKKIDAKADPTVIADAEKLLTEAEATFRASILQKQRTADGVPYAEALPALTEKVTGSVFDGKVSVDGKELPLFTADGRVNPEARLAFRNQVVAELASQGLKVSTDNVKAIDSMIDLAITARQHGIIDQPGGITRAQFYQVVGELYLHSNPAVRIGATELTHVPMVVEGTLNHYEMMMAAKGENATVGEKKAMFLAALLHDAGKWDPNIKTRTGYTILKTSFFNKTGEDIVVKPGQSLREAMKAQGIDPSKVTLPFDGMAAILVHHDATTVRSQIKNLVDLGVITPMEGQKMWEAIQYHGFVSSWVVNNSLGGLGIKSHVFNEGYDKQLKPYLDAFQRVSKSLGEKGIPDLQKKMEDPAFAKDVAAMRAAFEKLPPYVQALMLGDHQGQIDIAKYMTILSTVPANKDASIAQLFFGDTMTNSIAGVLRTHSYEQMLLSDPQGKAAQPAFLAAEKWMLNADPNTPGLAKAILSNPELRSKFESWKAEQKDTVTVVDWLKTLKVRQDGKNTEEFNQIQAAVEKSFYEFYSLSGEDPLAWRGKGPALPEAPPTPARRPTQFGYEVSTSFDIGLRRLLNAPGGEVFDEWRGPFAGLVHSIRNLFRAQADVKVPGFVTGSEDAGFPHNVQRHFFLSEGRGPKKAGIYDGPVDIENIQKATVSSWDQISVSYDQNGRRVFLFQKIFPREIGTDSGGKRTSTNVVILNAEGEIITGFPATASAKDWVSRQEMDQNNGNLAEIWNKRDRESGALRSDLYNPEVPVTTVNKRTRASYIDKVHKAEEGHGEKPKPEEVSFTAKGKKNLKSVAIGKMVEMYFEEPLGYREVRQPNGKVEKVALHWNRVILDDKNNLIGSYPVAEAGEKVSVPEENWNPVFQEKGDKAAQDAKPAVAGKAAKGSTVKAAAHGESEVATRMAVRSADYHEQVLEVSGPEMKSGGLLAPRIPGRREPNIGIVWKVKSINGDRLVLTEGRKFSGTDKATPLTEDATVRVDRASDFKVDEEVRYYPAMAGGSDGDLSLRPVAVTKDAPAGAKPSESKISVQGIFEGDGHSLPGAVMIPHQPGAQGYPFTGYRKLSVTGIDPDNGVISLSREGSKDPIQFKFDPKKPPEFLKELKVGMEVDILHGGGGSAFRGGGDAASQFLDLQIPPGFDKIVIGRDSNASHIVLQSDKVSSSHATIEKGKDGNWYLMDGIRDANDQYQPSTNGVSTWKSVRSADGTVREDWVPVGREDWHLLTDGEYLKFGDTVMQFKAPTSDAKVVYDDVSQRSIPADQEITQPQTSFPQDWTNFQASLPSANIDLNQIPISVSEVQVYSGDPQSVNAQGLPALVITDYVMPGQAQLAGTLRRTPEGWKYFPVDGQGVLDNQYRSFAPDHDGGYWLPADGWLNIGYASFKIENNRLVSNPDMNQLTGVDVSLKTPDKILAAADSRADQYVDQVFQQPPPQPVLLSGDVDFRQQIPIHVTPATSDMGELAQVTTQGEGYGKTNEDAVVSIRTADGRLVLMDIDGMGGHGNGDAAARLIAEAHNVEMERNGYVDRAWKVANLAVRRFNGVMNKEIHEAEQRGDSIEDPKFLAQVREKAMAEARKIIQHPHLISDGPMDQGAGAVAVQVEIVPPQQPGQPYGMRFHWAGDARAMLLHRGSDGKWNWSYRTVDENMPNAPGMLKPGEDFEVGGRGRTLAGVRHPLANRVMNGIGVGDEVRVRSTPSGEIQDPNSPTGSREAGDAYKNGVAVQPGDMLLVGSDGFWENFGNTRVAMELIQNATTAQEANRILTEETHTRMRILSQARNRELPRESNGRFRFERPDGTLYVDQNGQMQRAKTMWIDSKGGVYDSPTAEKAVDNYKLDNFSLMVYQHELPISPDGPTGRHGPVSRGDSGAKGGDADVAAKPVPGPVKPVNPRDLQDLAQKMQYKWERLSNTIQGMGEVRGTSKKFTPDELQELLYMVLERGLDPHRLPRSSKLREGVEEYMVSFVTEMANLYPEEMNRPVNPITGERMQKPSTSNPKVMVPIYEAQYQYARMLLNQQLGRPLTGEPSLREKNTVITFAERALGFEVKTQPEDYDQARKLIREKILQGDPTIEAALKSARANMKFYALKTLIGDQPQMPLNDAAQGVALVKFLGKIGFDQEVGVTVSMWNNKPEYRFIIGNWDHIAQVKMKEYFLIHSHLKYYANPASQVMGQGGVTLVSDVGKEHRTSVGVLFSKQDLVGILHDAEELGRQDQSIPMLYDAKQKVFRNWVQHPYGMAETEVHLDANGKPEQVTVRYAFDEKEGLDHRKIKEHLPELNQMIRKLYPDVKLVVEETSIDKIQPERMLSPATVPPPEPINAFDAEGPMKPWADKVAQLPKQSAEIPEAVQQQLDRIIEKSDQTGHEYGVITVQVGDRIITYETPSGVDYVTSHHEKEVGGKEYAKAVIHILNELKMNSPVLKGLPVKIYMFHTHPKRDLPEGSLIKSPIYQHSDGEAYTHINAPDAESGDRVFKVFQENLQNFGYTGSMEMITGAVPAKTGMEGKNPYISVYRRGS